MPVPDFNTLPAGLIHLRNSGGEQVIISLYGAQVLSWQSAGGHERLYCSPVLPDQAGPAIRGGVPVCFPQFSERGTLPKHGLVRNALWQAESGTDTVPQEIARARLWIGDSAATRALWPQQFRLQLDIEIGPGWLSMTLGVRNHGHESFCFSAALHTYLATADVRALGIVGLQGVAYIDTARQHTRARQSEAVLHIAQETDRIYLSPPAALQVQDGGRPLLHIRQEGFSDSVVWNPGPLKAAGLGDMPAADWTRMLCIEAAQVAQPIALAPLAHWRGMQHISVAPQATLTR